tara:strand:+ start:104 stop:514 length:411 start_codon:yes stop_codon:yes gene_type:complete
MSEFEIQSLFNSFLISNALFFAGNVFLLWVAFRASLGIRDNGGNLLSKVLVSLFGLGIVYLNLQNGGFLQVNWESTAYALGQLDTLTENGQRFVDFLNITEPPTFSLIPSNPIFIVWWIVVTAMILLPIWVKKENM